MGYEVPDELTLRKRFADEIRQLGYLDPELERRLSDSILRKRIARVLFSRPAHEPSIGAIDCNDPTVYENGVNFRRPYGPGIAVPLAAIVPLRPDEK